VKVGDLVRWYCSDYINPDGTEVVVERYVIGLLVTTSLFGDDRWVEILTFGIPSQIAHYSDVEVISESR